jgi:hypothetical protein
MCGCRPDMDTQVQVLVVVNAFAAVSLSGLTKSNNFKTVCRFIN